MHVENEKVSYGRGQREREKATFSIDSMTMSCGLQNFELEKAKGHEIYKNKFKELTRYPIFFQFLSTTNSSFQPSKTMEQ